MHGASLQALYTLVYNRIIIFTCQSGDLPLFH